ncbi:MAG TPA: TIGR03086 family metal-binding protein [Streptosporangiaceae bacterium]|nr:TIGR03086 family metal-binding protein [Streptosporangiaceae bacterium]
MGALDAVGKRNVELVAQVKPEQWGDPTPCAEWNVRTLVGHLIAGRYVYRGFLEGVPVAELRAILQRQGEAVGDDAAAACERAVRSIGEAFAVPGALERTVHHTVGDMPGSELLVQLVADCVVHTWDLATAIGADPGLDEELIELACEFYAPRMQKEAIYAYGWFKPPATPLPEGATPLQRLIHLVGR